jgi:hypothetical protein
MQINVGPKNLGQLFMGNTTVSVPSFQRNYSWTRDQIDQFLIDVYESAESNQPHFWGPVVFLRLPNEESNLQVIDGQQRLTTSIIFLSILRDLAKSLSDPIINPNLPGAFDIGVVVRNFLYLPHTYVVPRFTGSYMIEDVLEKYILTDPVSNGVPRPALTVGGAGMSSTVKINSKELRRAYHQMKSSLETKLSQQNEENKKHFISNVFMGLTDLFEIHAMELNNEDDAYLLFESLNDRGLRLNPSDLLKTLTLREIRAVNGHLTVESALTIWDETVENLGDYDFTKFLRHYLLTQVPPPKKIQANKIFGSFKAQIEELGHHGAEQNLRRIQKSSEFYSQLLGQASNSNVTLQESFARINTYSETHRVFLLGMLQTNIDTDLQLKLTRAIEHLSFRWIVAGKNAQELEGIYQQQVHILRGDPSTETALSVCENLMAHAPLDAEIDDVIWNDSPFLQRYILRRIESLSGGAVAGTPTIEHLAPQNPPDNNPHWTDAVAQRGTPNEEGLDYDDYVRSWGNLTLLENKLNSSIQNSPWPIKLTGDPSSQYEGINASNYNLNTPIKTSPTWTKTQIISRADWLRSTTFLLTGAQWVRTGHVQIQKWRNPSQ